MARNGGFVEGNQYRAVHSFANAQFSDAEMILQQPMVWPAVMAAATHKNTTTRLLDFGAAVSIQFWVFNFRAITGPGERSLPTAVPTNAQLKVCTANFRLKVLVAPPPIAC